MVMDWFDSKRLDEVLKLFGNVKDGRIPSSLLLDDENAPEDWSRAVHFLAEEGYLKEQYDCFEITYRGKAMLRNGGFLRQNRRERVLFYCTVIAAVCGFAGLLVSLVALVCQIRG